MGHRLITALTFLNAMALFACIILIAIATTRDTNKVVIPKELVAQQRGQHFSATIGFALLSISVSRICHEPLSNLNPGLPESVCEHFA